MGKTGYIIQSIGYEYDDETYSKGEGGTPEAIIIDREAAKKRMLELEIKSWRNECLGHYGYDLEDIAKDEDKFEEALKDAGVDLEDSEMQIPTGATDEQIMKLIKYSKIRFHEIIEIEIEGLNEDPSNDEIEPAVEILDMQSSMAANKKGGIFGEVDEFTSGNVEPVKINFTGEIAYIKEAVEEVKDDFLSIKEEMKRLRDEARSKVKNFFIKGMDSIFDMYPEVKSVNWHQYTPYFNDGDECTFRCYAADDFGVNGYGDYNDNGDDGEINVLEYDYNNGRQYTYHKGEEIQNTISGFLGQLDSDDYKTMFGDHAKVIVRKGEITVEEYEHD